MRRQLVRTVLATAGVLAVGLLVGPAHSGAAPGSPITSVPFSAPGPSGASLNSVSCPTATRCIAVGSLQAEFSVPVVATRAGSTWTSVEPPLPDGGQWGELTKVNCPSVTWCLALGDSHVLNQPFSTTFLETYSDHRWTASLPPVPDGAGSVTVTSLACGSTDNCVIVGSYLDASGHQHGLAEHLVAGTWTKEAITPPIAHDSVSLVDVSCHFTTYCVAIGTLGSGEAIAYTFDGMTWTPALLPIPSGASDAQIQKVSCPQPGVCWASGIDYDSGNEAMLVELLSGGQWTSGDVRLPSGFVGEIVGMSCTEATTCVGIAANQYFAYAETFLGTAWRRATLPVPPGVYNGFSILGLDCWANRRCMAVGNGTLGGGFGHAVDEMLAASTWTPELTPISNPPEAALTSVACTAAATCTAAGSYFPATGPSRPFVDSRTSSGWSHPVDLPVVDQSSEPTVSGIACPAAGDCIVTGTDVVGDARVGVVYRGAGEAWTASELELPEAGTSVSITSPSCPTLDFCAAAVAYTTPKGRVQTVATLSGGTWSFAAVPLPVGGGALSTVACAALGACVAIGVSGSQDLFADKLAAGGWTLTAIPDSGGAEIVSMSCSTTAACIAVGATGRTVSDFEDPVIVTMNHDHWAVSKPPVPDGDRNEIFTGVSCLGPSRCVASGYATGLTPFVQTPLVDVLSSTGWTVTLVPNQPSVFDATFNAVSCTAPGGCQVVGDELTSDGGDHPISFHQAD